MLCVLGMLVYYITQVLIYNNRHRFCSLEDIDYITTAVPYGLDILTRNALCNLCMKIPLLSPLMRSAWGTRAGVQNSPRGPSMD